MKVKTMTTLLAAVLIAMMGVMPALAINSDPIPFSVTVEEQYVLGITVTGDGAFGSVVQDQSTSLTTPLDLTVTSPGAATVDAEMLNGTVILLSGLFVEHMTVYVDDDPTGTSVAFFGINATRGITSYNINATIDVPGNYAVGPESASLVFWITA